MQYYYTYDEKLQRPLKTSLGEFANHVQAKLKEKGFEVPLEMVYSLIQVSRGNDTSDLTEEQVKWSLVTRGVLHESEELGKKLGDTKQGKERNKNERATNQKEAHIKEEQEALVKAEKYGLTVQTDTTALVTTRLQEVVGANFDVLPNGGLKLKKNASFSFEDALTGVSGLLGMAEAGQLMAGISTLALGDMIVAAERKFGERLDLTQLKVSGKGESLLRQARAISEQFGAEERAELDKDGNLGFGHWQEIALTQGLKKGQRTKLASHAAKRKPTTKNLRSLAKSVAKVADEDRDALISRFDAELPTTEAAIEGTKRFLEATGLDTGDLQKYLYIGVDHGGSLEVVVSNGLDTELAKNSDQIIKLGHKLKWSTNGDVWKGVDFQRARPDALQKDELTPTRDEEDEEEYEPPVEAYGDWEVFEENGQWVADGTIDGKEEPGLVLVATTKQQAIEALKAEFRLDDEFRDDEGRFFNIH